MSRNRCAGNVGVVIIWLLCLLVSTTVFAAEGKKIATVAIPTSFKSYSTVPQPLTANQCGQCHIGVFRDI